MTRRGWLVLAAALVVLATTAGTSAFSAASLDRSVQIDVADDQSAYLGVSVTGNATNNTTTATVTVTNQLPGDIALTTVTATDEGDSTSLTPGDGSLDGGDTTSATIENVTCGETVVIHASGDAVTVTLEREIQCT
ncbi:hypothetical protein [Halorubellus sp. PRR65]|uniref:hypothetical protein n=1 Tax=Halorubellus sp. PRR65 TaxID=3098148 RepID=UPI002B259FA5|nr:hypothetical protein [Halorubellus sp. PRR65]